LGDVDASSSTTTHENRESDLIGSQSSRTESSSDRELSSIAVDGDLDSWDSQVMHIDLPLDMDWSLLDTDLSVLLATQDASSDISFLPNFTPPDSIAAPLLQDCEVASTTFPDTYLLPIPELALLRACLTVATRLGISMLIWDCESISPFYLGSAMSPGISGDNFASGSSCSSGLDVDISSLPENLQPTRTQRLLPHHPMLDILPWPTVRDKLIMFFSQPPELRPANISMGQLVEDLEDEADGVVVKGGGTGPWDADSWEVGKALEKRWWFALDSKVKRRR
jgi:Domain of unknown function (DUF3425)